MSWVKNICRQGELNYAIRDVSFQVNWKDTYLAKEYKNRNTTLLSPSYLEQTKEDSWIIP